MNCHRFREVISLFAGRDLDDAAQREVRAHLLECRACATQVEHHGAQTSLLARYGRESQHESARPDLWSRLRNQLPEGSPATAPSYAWRERRRG